MKHFTKKEFTERVYVSVYGKGSGRRVRLYYDWNNDLERGAIGYKYMLMGYGVTKKDIINDAYDILIKNNHATLSRYNMKVAQTDQARFKVPLIG